MESASGLKWSSKAKVQKWVKESYFDEDIPDSLRKWIHRMAHKWAKTLHEDDSQTAEEIEMALTNISIGARISWVGILDKVLDTQEYRRIFSAELSTSSIDWVKEARIAIKQLSIRLLDFSANPKKDEETLIHCVHQERAEYRPGP